jgi:hypothetical protein
VNGPGWRECLTGNRKAFIEEFVQRPQFSAEYSFDLTPDNFVTQLNAKAGEPCSFFPPSLCVFSFALIMMLAFNPVTTNQEKDESISDSN